MNFNSVAVDTVKQYWDARPCNIRHSTKPIGTREYFDEVEARKYKVEPHIPGFADFNAWKGKKVLEVGCGIGTDTMNFARAGAQLTSVDLSTESIALAKQRAEVMGLSDKIKFYQANAEKLSEYVPMDQYDLAYSFGVIHHTPDPDAALREIRKFLPKGGKLKLMVYYRYSWKVLWIMMTDGKFQFWKLNEYVARNSEAQTGCPVTYIYSKKEGREFVERAGFKATKISADHIFPYEIPAYKEYRYVREWYWRWMPNAMFRWLERRFGWHLLIDAEAV